MSGGEANEEENRREISLPPLRRNGTVLGRRTVSVPVAVAAEIRRWVASRRTRAGSEEEKGWGREAAGRRAVIACWVIYLVILADRPRARSTGRSRGLLTRGGQPPALLEIKNSLYYTSHSTLSRFDPSARPPPHHLLLILRRRATSRVLFSLPLTSPPAPPCPPYSSYSAALRRRLVHADRLNMRPAIPDGTNIIKVRPHAKPVKYRPTPFRPSTLFPSSARHIPSAHRLSRRPFGPSRAPEGFLPSPFPFAPFATLSLLSLACTENQVTFEPSRCRVGR